MDGQDGDLAITYDKFLYQKKYFLPLRGPEI